VFWWNVNGTILYGTVESTSRMTDVSGNFSGNMLLIDNFEQGTQVVNVERDGGGIVSLPVSSMSKVT